MSEYNYQFEQSAITIQIGDAKCVLTCVDGKIHAEGDMYVGAQGLFEQVCEMWNTRTPQCEKDCEGYWAARAQVIDECLDIVTTYGHPDVIETAIKQRKEQP